MATKTEVERLSVVETKVDAIQADVKEIKESIIGLDNKFAAKWVQSAVAFVIGIIVSAVLVALVALVVMPQEKQPASGSTGAGVTPSANANASAQSTPSDPSDSNSSSSGGLLNEIPKIGL